MRDDLRYRRDTFQYRSDRSTHSFCVWRDLWRSLDSTRLVWSGTKQPNAIGGKMDELGKRLIRDRDAIEEKLAMANKLESEAAELRREAAEIRRLSDLARQRL